MQVVVGTDVCKVVGVRETVWVFVRLVNGAFESAAIYRHFAVGVDASGDAAVIAVDIPIRYPPPPARARSADGAARDFVSPRTSTVFNALHPYVLLEPDQPSASARSLELTGKGVGSTAFALRDKMLQVAPVAERDPRIYEVHPEVSFRALAGHPLAPKWSWDGHIERRIVLAQAGIVIPDDLGRAGTAGVDDILDAAAAAWSARRIAAGRGVSLPNPPEVDTNGRPVAIWY